ncbi:MAG: ribose 5-phosphate isomerase A, partial [Candidatus Korarchaeota archaeon]|nr:ribose 5-phosphate isomerase A [Candidatus Korarchaeota archaeon]NIW51087.1 ribose 5-phosphate isomerase A [Candidatus Korarchaeota archaeon]
VVTDNGNFVLDVGFGVVDDPRELDARLKLVPGVLETGLFVGMADFVYVGGRTGIQRLLRG